jgi:hypothetical protein
VETAAFHWTRSCGFAASCARPRRSQLQVADPVGESARSWLSLEIAAGRLAPCLDEAQLVVIAGVLRTEAMSPRTSRKKKPVDVIAPTGSKEAAGGVHTDLSAV